MTNSKSNHHGIIFANGDSIWMEIESHNKAYSQKPQLDISYADFFNRFPSSAGGALYCFRKKGRVFGYLDGNRISKIDFTETHEEYRREVGIFNQQHQDMARKPAPSHSTCLGMLRVGKTNTRFEFDEQSYEIKTNQDLYEWCRSQILADGQDEWPAPLHYRDATIYGVVNENQCQIELVGLNVHVCDLNYRLGDCGVLPQGPS